MTIATAADGLLDASGSAGLRWKPSGTGLDTRPVLFHVWRDEAGDGEGPAPPRAPKPLTRDRPVMPVDPPGAPQRPPDWPPLNMHFVDRGLAEGWYRYALNGIDLFGRHSAVGAPARWWQWAPQPNPVPWYYAQPAVNRVVHQNAIRILDTIGPPPPSGVEAWALDPEDPYLQRDAAFESWRSGLSPGQRELIGLRIRWQWTDAHRRQAPDTAEFRIYYAGGSKPPAGRERATAWGSRVFVVGFDQHVSVGTDAQGRPLRRYEVFLPFADGLPQGLPLEPTLSDPVAYAHVAVSAADKRQHAADDAKWNGTAFGGRRGNEGPVGMAVKVFRVRRTPPPPPLPPPADGERVFATAADYHGDSYYTYRWVPRPPLKAHVLRAVDEAVFEADRAQRLRGRPLLGASDATAFPRAADEPRWDSRKRQQVANELNALEPLKNNPAAARAAYRKLSNDGLRVLAGLPGVEAAFVQVTVNPLDPADPANANRAGPDNPAGYPVNSGLRAFVDRLPGAASNRYLYRAVYVDPAHNRSGLSQATAPVWLPNVIPPRTPAVPRALAGERKLTLSWPSNREPDLAAYRVYRAEDEAAARDLRTMTLVQTVAVPAGDPAARPAAVAWTDAPLPGLVDFRYRVVAVDDAGNPSEPTVAVVARAHDEGMPQLPALDVSWQGAGAARRVRLKWDSPHEVLVQRRTVGAGGPWVDLAYWRPPGENTAKDPFSDPRHDQQYRVWARKETGAVARGKPRTVAAP